MQYISNIIEDQEKGIVKIDNLELFGFILRNEKCKFCSDHPVYYEKYDAKFCAQENKWLEAACSDPDCDYCKNRPILPL